MWGKTLEDKYQKKWSNGRCDCCEKQAKTYDAQWVGIMYSGKLMDDMSYRIINDLNKKEEDDKKTPIKLVFWQK